MRRESFALKIPLLQREESKRILKGRRQTHHQGPGKGWKLLGADGGSWGMGSLRHFFSQDINALCLADYKSSHLGWRSWHDNKAKVTSGHLSTKECANHRTIALISHASKVMLKILHARLQHYVTQEIPDVQAGFSRRKGTRDQIANIPWVIEKARKFQKNIYLCFINYAKAFNYVDHGKLWKAFRVMGPSYLSPEKPVCGSRSSSQNPV